ncbi:MAG: site-specific integrase [Halobacteriota archaeon]
MKHINDYLEKEAIDRILDTAKVYNYRDYLIIRILWRSGMRASELLGLTPAAIEWQNNVINVINGKGGKDRRVYLDSETM